MKASTARKSHGYENSKHEEYARWRRRDHDNIEAMQNLMMAEIVERRCNGLEDKDRKPFEMSAKVRQLVSAIQGAHGGGEVVNDEFQRGYLGIGQQLHFIGRPEAIRARVRNWINALLLWQDSCGFTLITVKKGGNVIGLDDQGEEIRECSTFIDHLLPVADEAVQLARLSPTWAKNPGDALLEQVGAALKRLPSFKPKPLPTPDKKDEGKGGKDSSVVSLTQYQQDKEKQIVGQVEQAIQQIEELEGDGVLWARRKLLSKLRDTIDSLERTYGARRSWIMPDEDDEETPDEVGASGSAYKGDNFSPDLPVQPVSLQEGEGHKNMTLPLEEIQENDMKTSEAALRYAALGTAVFPTRPDKTPATKNGFKDATTDPEQIKRWYATHPEYGIGIPTGKASGWLALDVDPRHGGDASLTALVEEYGDLPDTSRARTGGGGDHYIFENPETVEIPNSVNKLGAGLDIRGEGGYIIVAPSSHPSGGVYSWANALAPAKPPAWLINRLLLREHRPIDTDENPVLRPRSGMGLVIPDGQRGNKIFQIGCAIWGKGEAANYADLEAQLSEINQHRCVPPLEAERVRSAAASIAKRYDRGKSISDSEVAEGQKQYAEDFTL